MSENPLLEVKNLKVYFYLKDGVVKAVEGASFKINRGEIVGLAGESGCGKSVTTQAILRLVPPPGRVEEGEVLLDGKNIYDLSREEMRNIRGSRISIVFQNAMAALNPVIPVGEQIADVYRDHKGGKFKQAISKAVDMMRRVGIAMPEQRSHQFAHEFSGGMQQRAVIAASLMCNPDLIIADEPTTALDVTIQMQILALLKHAQETYGTAILYISHDLATVSRICERVIIMYAGEIVESACTEDLYGEPLHPYTQGLLSSIPPLEGGTERFLKAIEGQPPKPTEYPSGCRFAPRCPFVVDRCRAARPPLLTFGEHTVRCIRYEDRANGDTH
jgi:peptide/nickel transport system ATP-binding protein